ncbi:OLC1v1014261C1 [Oldenlandia corymbosa var. corymbosa]|uniref:OLC1v1014261C1 n=1 Tax=Oldenlandia corymbosa var. corymbosa TaxID=529605 RepID=A0AAV1E2G3_OLDCO|nr:OLC1v1014261C1 [Oldenlandia corymbosa var. corymbosa]
MPMQRFVDNVLAVTKESVKTITYEWVNNIVRLINGASALLLAFLPGKASILEGIHGWELRPTFRGPKLPRWMENGASSFNQLIHDLSVDSDTSSSQDNSSDEEYSEEHVPGSPLSQTSRVSRSPSFTKRDRRHTSWIRCIFMWLLLPLKLLFRIPFYLCNLTSCWISNPPTAPRSPRPSYLHSPRRRQSLKDHFVQRATDQRRGVVEDIHLAIEIFIESVFDIFHRVASCFLSPLDTLRWICSHISGPRVPDVQVSVPTATLADNDPAPTEKKTTFRNPLNTDARTCEDVITELGYPYESIRVVTADGYVLVLERIPRRDARKVVYLQHGILDSSMGWVSNGVVGSPAFAAFDQGYDVFLGNLRGLVSREHVDKNISSRQYWSYSVNEHGTEDIPAIIEKIHELKVSELKSTQSDQEGEGTDEQPYKLCAICHSLGGASILMYVVTQRMKQKSHRLSRMILLSPAGFHHDSTFVFTLVERLFFMFAPILAPLVPAFYIPTRFFRMLLNKLARDFHNLPAVGGLVQTLMSYFVGGDSSNWVGVLGLPHYNMNDMPGVSFRVALHLAQLKRTKRFRMFDYGKASVNMKVYGSPEPIDVGENYGLIDIPVDLVAGKKDKVIRPSMIRKHYKLMKDSGVEVSYKEFEYAHLDFTFSHHEELLAYVMSRLLLVEPYPKKLHTQKSLKQRKKGGTKEQQNALKPPSFPAARFTHTSFGFNPVVFADSDRVSRNLFLTKFSLLLSPNRYSIPWSENPSVEADNAGAVEPQLLQVKSPSLLHRLFPSSDWASASTAFFFSPSGSEVSMTFWESSSTFQSCLCFWLNICLKVSGISIYYCLGMGLEEEVIDRVGNKDTKSKEKSKKHKTDAVRGDVICEPGNVGADRVFDDGTGFENESGERGDIEKKKKNKKKKKFKHILETQENDGDTKRVENDSKKEYEVHEQKKHDVNAIKKVKKKKRKESDKCGSSDSPLQEKSFEDLEGRSTTGEHNIELQDGSGAIAVGLESYRIDVSSEHKKTKKKRKTSKSNLDLGEPLGDSHDLESGEKMVRRKKRKREKDQSIGSEGEGQEHELNYLDSKRQSNVAERDSNETLKGTNVGVISEDDVVMKDKKRKKKCKKRKGDLGSGADTTMDSHLNDDETEGRQDEANSVENESEDPKTRKCKKKVRFSGEDELFALPEEELVRGKRFSEEEDEMVRAAVYNYIEAHDLGDEGLDMVLHCRSNPKTRNCWEEIAAAVPHRPRSSVYFRAHVLFQRDEKRKWTKEEMEQLQELHKKHGNKWKALADELGKYRYHVKDAWRNIRHESMKHGKWSQDEYQSLFDLVNLDLRMKYFEEKHSKYGMLRDNIPWTAISDKLTTRVEPACCYKWYYSLSSPMVGEKIWLDSDDYRMLDALYQLDATCYEDVDWDNLLEHRSGDVCQRRWKEMVRYIGDSKKKPFPDQVEVLAKRYCPELLDARENWENKPYVS